MPRLAPRAVALCLALNVSVAMGHVDLSVSPACPLSDRQTILRADQGQDSPALVGQILTLEKSPNGEIKVVTVGVELAIEGPPTYVDVSLGALQPGWYHASFYTRTRLYDGNLGPEVLQNDTDFLVESPQASASCSPWKVSLSSSKAVSTSAGTPFPAPIVVRVTDDAGRGVPNALVRFAKQTSPFDSYVDVSDAGAQLSQVAPLTDSNGLASISATAMEVPGSYTYTARVTRANIVARAYVTMSNRLASNQDSAIAVVEYAGRNWHYFMTSNPSEMDLLDSGAIAGWTRTGSVFLAYPARSTIATSPVCRFYGKPEFGLDSHFFSASSVECAQVLAKFSPPWTLETADAFGMGLPNTSSGTCIAGTQPIYRLFNNKADANHRYIPNAALIPAMVSSGWIREGYGVGVAMCAPL